MHLISVYQRGTKGGAAGTIRPHSCFRPLCCPDSRSSKCPGSGGVLLRLLLTAAHSWPVDLDFSVTPRPAPSVSTFAAAEHLRRKPQHTSCFSEDRSGRNVEDSLVLILHQRINQFKYKSIDKLFKSLFFFCRIREERAEGKVKTISD